MFLLWQQDNYIAQTEYWEMLGHLIHLSMTMEKYWWVIFAPFTMSNIIMKKQECLEKLHI